MRTAALIGTFLAALVSAGSAAASPFLYAWASHEDSAQGDFLAVYGADPRSADYGQLLATAPTGKAGGAAHHLEYETPAGATLFANDWGTGETFVFDLTDRAKPRVAASFERAGDYIYPHSFARLPNGNVLATFQSKGDKYAPPGGLVELDNHGRLVRSSSSATPDIPNAINWPYSLIVVPTANRAISTSTDMGRGPDWTSPDTNHVQIWALDTLKLLASVALPPAPAPAGKVNIFPAEPRQLADGSVYVNTFMCGLYRIEGLATAQPSATFVHAFPGGTNWDNACAVPLVYGKYWIQTVAEINGLVVLDVSDPVHPREVSRLSLPHKWHMPHWIAADRSTGQVAVTGHHGDWLAMLKFDEASGSLSVDQAFGTAGAIALDRPDWPHKAKGKAIVHGVLFSR